MILGCNVVHDVPEWSGFRPFRNAGLQIEPPWSGDWNARVYSATLNPVTTYRMAVSSGGKARGRYSFRLRAPEQAAPILYFRGDVLVENDVVTIGTGNVWAELSVRALVDVADISIELFDAEQIHDVDPIWSHDFRAAITPFRAWRAMDFCGCGSRAGTVANSESFGGFARRAPNPNDVSPYGTWGPNTGVNPKFWFPPGPDIYWINCPLLIALDPTKRAFWLAEAARWVPKKAKQVMVAVDNEMENNSFTVARFAYEHARFLDTDQAVARTLGILLLTKQLKNTIRDMGLQEKFMAVFETMPRNFWPFSDWNGEPVSMQARELVSEIGHLATSPYIGREISELGQLHVSMQEEFDAMSRWRTILDRFSVKLHAYECGFHFPPRHPSWWERDPVVINSVDPYLNGLNQIFASDAVVCWYGLCESDQWGLIRKLDDIHNDQLYSAVVNWNA